MSTISIKPVKLSKSSTGSWLRTWSNGAKTLVHDEHSNAWRSNPDRLSANVYRSEDGKAWTVRLFTHRDTRAVVDVDKLREARLLLGWLAENYQPHWYDNEALRKASAAMNGFEADRIHAELVAAGLY